MADKRDYYEVLGVSKNASDSELKSAYRKLAKKYHTSHIRISKLFKENGINIQNIGKRRDVTDGEIKKWIEEYDNGLSMEQLSKKYGVRVKKIRSIFRDYGVTIAKWRNHIKKEKPHYALR